MKVVILCGGQGTRLREKTESIPKALVEIGGKPMLWHIMKIYASYGYKEFVICLGYKGQLIKEYFMADMRWKYQDFNLDMTNEKKPVKLLNGDRLDWKIDFVDTGEETNTGGRIKQVASLIKEEDFMVTYGDGVADIDIKKLVKYHKKHKKIGTVTAVNATSQFGVLDIKKGNGVKTFCEKPSTEQWINGGFFVFNRKFLKYLGKNDALEKKPLEKLASDGELVAFKHNSYWKCMDTYKDNIQLNKQWASGKAPWRVW